MAAPCAILPHALVLLFLAFGCVLAFKEHDFKKCDTANFCQRNRGVSGKNYMVEPGSVRTQGPSLHAILVNSDGGAQFNLTILSYGGTVRVVVDELHNPASSKPRHQIPDILEAGIEAGASQWLATDVSDGAWKGTSGATLVMLSYHPFRLSFSVGSEPALEMNSRNMFGFEHRRVKQDNDPNGWWEETFNGHTDSKPKGPEAISLDMVFPGAVHVYGIPERATDLALKPTVGQNGAHLSEPYRLYNLDVFEYLDTSPFGLYGAIPVMLAHKPGLTTAVFWHNAAEMFVDVKQETKATAVQWIAESGILDLFVLPGPSPANVMEQYAALTGTTGMPQMFALGYHQCRWNYKDEADVSQVDAGFDDHAIPYDVLWLDIEHTNGKRYLTWDQHHFPSPVRMQEDVASRGRKMVTIVDPHVKRDHSYYIHAEASKLNFYVRNQHGTEFDGWCWPGSSSYLDVTNPEVREWWRMQFTPDRYQGSTRHLYIWNDMNEPSVFNGPEITMPKDNLHFGDIEHRDIHNVFGYYYHLATADALIHRGEVLNGADGDRPFVLSRAFFSGTQRVGPIWTGDNAAQWSHLKVSVPMLLTLGLAGLPYSGADVGGFFGNPDAELLVRWYQLGTYYPFFRGHAHLETQRREPWLFGEDSTARIRSAIRERYALLPYIYTLFRHANLTNMPLMRPLWFEFPAEQELFAVQEEFLLGPGLLVKPVVQAGASQVEVLLPRASPWYDVATGETVKPGKDQVYRAKVTMNGIPAFYRGGYIIPRRERPRRSTATMAGDPFTLVIALAANGSASGDLYLDDGHSFAFRRGQYLHRRFTFVEGTLTNSREPSAHGVPAGVLRLDLYIERVVVLGLPGAGKRAYTASSGSTAFVAGWGAVDVRRGAAGKALIVRQPKLPVANDWQLVISPSKS